MARQILEAIADGILGGGVYALMAAGLTLIFGVLDIINIAQGILVVLGCLSELRAPPSSPPHLDLFVGLADHRASVDVRDRGGRCRWLFIRPLRGSERTSMTLLACYAVALIIEGILYWVFGPNFVSLNAWFTQPNSSV